MAKVRLLVLVFIVSGNSAIAATESVSDLARRYRDLRLGKSVAAAGYKAIVGHATFALDTGTITPVLAGDQAIGYFLYGSGSFSYETAEKDEFTAVRYNAKTTGVKLQGSAEKIVIEEPITSVFLWGKGFADVTGTAAEPPAAAFDEHQKTFARQIYDPPASHLAILQAKNAPASRLVRAQVVTPQRPYLYIYDEAWTQRETLEVLRPPQWRTNADKNVLYDTLLSEQPIGRSSREPAPPNAMLTDLDVTLVASDGDDATLTVVETLVPQRRPLSALRFTLYNDYIYDINREPRRYHVRSITDEGGNKLTFSHAANDLVVGLAQAAPAGKPIKLRFEIDGNFLYRPSGSNYWELGIEPWFPWAEWNEQRYSYHSLVKVKKPFIPFGSGRTIRRGEEGEYNVLETKFEQPVSGVAILAGRYAFDEETRNGVTVRVASFLSKNPMAYKQLRNIAFAAIETYPMFLGPFPFEEITVIEKNELGYGQAPPGIVFITKEAFRPKQEEANAFVKGINMRFAHEIAHQYWGHVVKMPSFEEQWLEEAFADYSAALFMKLAGRKKDYENAINGWKADAREATKVASIPMANRLDNPGDPLGRALIRQYLLYNKGPYLLAALHRELGDQMFMTFLKSYQKSFRWKFGSTKDVIGLLEYLTKKNYKPFFEEHFWGTGFPSF